MARQRYRPDRGDLRPEDARFSERGLPICRFCKKNECAPPKRTFCSAHCVHEWKIQSDPTYAKKAVFQRDQGFCASCNANTVRQKAELIVLKFDDPELFARRLDEYAITEKQFNKRKDLYDIDHILEVAEGGGSASLDRLQTLCIRCHKAKTIDFNKRRKRR